MGDTPSTEASLECKFTPKSDDPREIVAELRDDFMRRWFAIAVSVGFATTVAGMKWVQEGRLPDYSEAQHIARLVAAILATLLSWEGYFQSIRKKRLYDLWRYLIDVFLVFMYLFLLLTSKFPYYWLGLHAFTFILYIIWDIFTITWYPQSYSETPRSLGSVYGLGIIGAEVDRGPVITLVWAIYFALVWLAFSAEIPYATFVFSGFVIMGLAGYRWCKANRTNLLLTYLTPLIAALIVLLVRHLYL